MDIYRDEKLFERGKALSGYFQDAMFALQAFEIVTDVRGYGMIAGIDFAPSGTPGAIGISIQKELFHGGLHVKATGDAIIVAPPLISNEAHIDEIRSKLSRVFESMSAK